MYLSFYRGANHVWVPFVSLAVDLHFIRCAFNYASNSIVKERFELQMNSLSTNFIDLTAVIGVLFRLRFDVTVNN